MSYFANHKYQLVLAFLLGCGLLFAILSPIKGIDFSDKQTYIALVTNIAIFSLVCYLFIVAYATLFSRLSLFSSKKIKQRLSRIQKILLWSALVSITLLALFLLYIIWSIEQSFLHTDIGGGINLPTLP